MEMRTIEGLIGTCASAADRRALFAAAALAGILARQRAACLLDSPDQVEQHIADQTRLALMYADALQRLIS